MDDPKSFRILALGAKGHGIINLNGEKHYIKNALPGEEWELSSKNLPRRLSDSSQRVVPPCPHFGLCGGCVAQHMQESLYIQWKIENIQKAFDQRGIKATINPLRLIPKRSRRRAFFGVDYRDDKVIIGFREEARHSLVDIAECLILDASIVSIFDDLKTIAKIAMPKNTAGRLVVTKLDCGLDIDFQNGFKQIAPDDRAEIFRISEKNNVVRLIVSGDTIFYRSDPYLTVGGVQINVPSSVFLQAVPEAEQIMIDALINALPQKVRHVCDLFCGVGTFTFPLAKKAAVSAFDNDRRAIAALEHASKRVQGLKPIQTHVRDLFREPLSRKELETFDVVVYDPPRIGAAEQTVRLAQAKVSTIIAVSCSASSLARDAKVLIDGGYKMGDVTPIDQFLYSSHLESITVFKKDI